MCETVVVVVGEGACDVVVEDDGHAVALVIGLEHVGACLAHDGVSVVGDFNLVGGPCEAASVEVVDVELAAPDGLVAAGAVGAAEACGVHEAGVYVVAPGQAQVVAAVQQRPEALSAPALEDVNLGRPCLGVVEPDGWPQVTAERQAESCGDDAVLDTLEAVYLADSPEVLPAVVFGGAEAYAELQHAVGVAHLTLVRVTGVVGVGNAPGFADGPV